MKRLSQRRDTWQTRSLDSVFLKFSSFFLRQVAGTEEALETSEFLESLGIEADSLPGLTSTHPKNRAQLGTADNQYFIQS
jgi:hypothetical protein